MNFTYESERLYLKVLNEDYAPLVLNFLFKNREEFQKFEAAKSPVYYTEKYQRSNLKLAFFSFTKLNYIRFYVFKKDDANTIIGTISFSNILRYPFSSACIGYKFDSDYQGQGFASEAIACASFAMFHDGGFHRIEAYVMPNNSRSAHALERVGYEYKGLARKSICICGTYEDHQRYALISDFTSQNPI